MFGMFFKRGRKSLVRMDERELRKTEILEIGRAHV